MPLRFRKVLIADERYESAGVFDVNGDGIPDIVSGAWWYEGPDFRKKHRIGDVTAHDEYFDDFSTIALDVNGDGRPDFITGGWWGRTLRWLENPGGAAHEWRAHAIAETGPIESTRAWDLDNDGVPEIVPNTPEDPLVAYRLERDRDKRGTGRFTAHRLFDGPQGHGLGAGDIAGHGRVDLVLNHGWLEAPAAPWSEPWTWHPEFRLFPSASVPILVADVNNDGMNDLIVGGGHEYGLDWIEQRRAADGTREWVRHPIDPFNSQYHDLHWADIDGDGQCELVTGKRYRAHCDKDPGATDPYGIYYFKWTGEGFVKQVVIYGDTRETTGCGIHFALADLRGSGRLDIVAPGKDGLYVFFNEGL